MGDERTALKNAHASPKDVGGEKNLRVSHHTEKACLHGWKQADRITPAEAAFEPLFSHQMIRRVRTKRADQDMVVR